MSLQILNRYFSLIALTIIMVLYYKPISSATCKRYANFARVSELRHKVVSVLMITLQQWQPKSRSVRQ